MKIIVGGREQISSATLLVPSGEDAWMEFSVNGWVVKIRVVFIEDESDKQQAFKLDPIDNHVVLTLKNWNNTLPSAITTPCVFGETGGREVSFLVTGYAVRGFKKLDFSFFWEVKNGL